jgi:hypothetical protein
MCRRDPGYGQVPHDRQHGSCATAGAQCCLKINLWRESAGHQAASRSAQYKYVATRVLVSQSDWIG